MNTMKHNNMNDINKTLKRLASRMGSESPEAAGSVRIGDVAVCRMSRGEYSLKITTQRQVAMMQELLDSGSPGCMYCDEEEAI